MVSGDNGRMLTRYGGAAGVLLVVVGLGTLTAWALGDDVAGIAVAARMSTPLALGFVAAGMGLLLFISGRPEAGGVAGLILAGQGLLGLGEHVFGRNLRLDDPFFQRMVARGMPQAGFAPVDWLAASVLLGAGLFILAKLGERPFRQSLAELVGFCVGGIGLSALVARSLGLGDVPWGGPGLEPMGAVAALGCTVAGSGLVAVNSGLRLERGRARLEAVIIGLGAVGSLLLARAIAVDDLGNLKHDVRAVATAHAAELESVLGRDLVFAEDMAAWMGIHEPEGSQWTAVLQRRLDRVPEALALAWVDSVGGLRLLVSRTPGPLEEVLRTASRRALGQQATKAAGLMTVGSGNLLAWAITGDGRDGGAAVLLSGADLLSGVTRRDDPADYRLEATEGGVPFFARGVAAPGLVQREWQDVVARTDRVPWTLHMEPGPALLADALSPLWLLTLLLGLTLTGSGAGLASAMRVAQTRADALARIRDSMEEEVEGRRRAEDAIRQRDRHYRRLMETAAEGIYVLDDEGRLRFVNERLVEMLGYRRSELLTMSIQDLVPAEDLVEEPLHWKEARSGKTVRSTRRFRRQDGTLIHVEISANKLEPGQYAAIVRDVTARRRAEEARARLAAIVEASDDAIIGKTTDGVITTWNSGAERLYGYAADEVVGRPSSVLMPSSRVEEEHRILARVAEGGHVDNLETVRLRKDGTRIEVALSLSPILDDDDALTGIASVARDITARKEMEAALRASEARFRSLIENASDGITILDADGTNRYLSPAAEKLTGYSGEAMEGRTAFDFVHPDEVAEAEAMWERILANPDEVSVWEARFRHADGRWRTFECTNANMLDDPAVQGVVVNTRDVTERKELEAQLRHGQRMEAMGRLAGGIAHDFNNLLTVIRGQCDLLLADVEEAAPRTLAEEIRVVQGAANRGALLTSQLLALGREQVLRPRVVDLNRIVEGMGELFVRVLGEDVRLETELADGLPDIKIDQGQLEQVIMNLVVNARAAMPEGGVLRLTTGVEEIGPEQATLDPVLEAGRAVALEVADTGSGMDETTLARIFEPFFTTKMDEGGTGLGLAVSYGIVTQSGGTIQVESQPGQGTTFTLRFPPTSEPRAPTSAAGDEAVDLQEVTGTILVVEDDPNVRRVARRILERAGFQVHAVDMAENALDLLERDVDHIGLVLTDLVLPGMGGRKLVDVVREQHPNVRLLVMSGYAQGSPGSREDLPEDVWFIQKPFSVEALEDTVRRALRS